MNDSKNDIAWNQLFNKYDILNRISTNRSVLITSSEINEFREARLMTKFDHKSQLPKLFKENHLSLLPVSRGSYVIGSFSIFHPFNKETTEINRFQFPPLLESLDYKNISSEATAINCAFVSEILHDFTRENKLMPTVNGRMGSSCFSFSVNSSQGPFTIEVDNSQIEIDGGYEGNRSLYLIEAKNYISDDFLIRQLFYPYRLWKNKISKPVIPVFLTYTNGIFHLREYSFYDNNHYNSIRLIKEKRYSLQNKNISREIIREIADSIPVISEPEDISFPQADSFERIINLCELLLQRNTLTKEEITENYDFVPRQADYYINAGRYLGLFQIAKNEGQAYCLLSDKGKQIFTLSIADRQIEFIKLILSHKVFKQVAQTYLNHRVLTKNIVIEIMKQSALYNINSESTYSRRASTILGWLNWIFSLTHTNSQPYTLFDLE